MQSITVAFVVSDENVTILRIMYGGQDWQADLTTDDLED